MDAVKFLRTYRRMCRVYDVCHKPGCPMQDVNHCDLHDPELDVEKAVEAAEKWDEEHPEKTMAEDFFEKHPNAPKGGSAMMTREEAIAVLREKYDYCKSFYDLAAHPEEDYTETTKYLQALRVALTALRPVIREQVEKLRGEWISLEPEIGLFECSMCDHMILQVKCNFCPSCGAPMTDEAVEMAMERLEALKDGKDD